MVLPGISGSLVLVIVGAYDTMTGAISNFAAAVIDGTDPTAALEPAITLLVFTAGTFVGILTFARLVSWAIDTHRAVTMTFLIGVMLGGLRAPYIEVTRSVETLTPSVGLGLLLAVAVGGGLVIALERVSGGL